MSNSKSYTDESPFLQSESILATLEEVEPEYDLQRLESPFLTNELSKDFVEFGEESWSESDETSQSDTADLVTFTAKTLPVRVAVLATREARTATQVEVLVYAHGLDVCGRVIEPRPATFITEPPFNLGDLVEASGRPIVLVVPFLDWEHLQKNKMGFGKNWHKLARPENLNGVVAEVLEKVAVLSGTASAPTLLRLILAGHSRAFGFFDALASARANPEMSQGALGRLSHIWALDTTYTSPVADWLAWIRSRDDLNVTVIYRQGTYWHEKTKTKRSLSTGVNGGEFLAQVKKSDGRLSVIPVASGKVRHCAIPKRYLPDLLRSLPTASPKAEEEEECDIETYGGPMESWTEDVPNEADELDETEAWDTESDELEVDDEEETSLESFEANDKELEEAFIGFPTNAEQQLEAEDASVEERLLSLEEEACGFETEVDNYEGIGYGDVPTELETPSVTEVVFPSGESLRVVTGFPEGKQEDYWDPSRSGNPLLDTGPAHKNKKLSPDFTVGELTTSGGVSSDVARIDPKLVDLLQRLRGYVGKAIKITSGYRSWKRNKQVYAGRKNPDGTPKKPTLSQHCGGRAADIEISGMNGLEISKAVIEACGPNIGIGLGNTFAHVDVRGFAAAWNYGGVKDSWVSEIKRYQKEKGSRRTSPAGGDSQLASRPTPALPAPPGTSPLPPPTPVTATGAFFKVDVRESLLNVRQEPVILSGNEKSNVVATLPDGHVVRAVTGKKQKGFLEVETSLNGALVRGFAFAKFLEPAPGVTEITFETPSPTPPATGITAVHMPRRAGTVTKRTMPAGAHSLNESDQPGRQGETAEARRAELAAILDWLAVDKPSHKRYQPHSGHTFCNVYAHDYCHLAGCYLPRVWWSAPAIEALAQGRTVKPLLGKTIDEKRANDLFRWLRDFGLRFGWRRTGTLTKLQTEVNQGAIGLIVARRIIDGKSGHIVAVVPETGDEQARRDSDGEVIAPLQSQAGVTNFRYGTSKAGWWKDPKFAEFAFWLHA